MHYTPKSDQPGRLTFKLSGNTYHAKCYADPALADGLLVEGSSYPVALTIEAEGKVEYANPGEPAFHIEKPDDNGDTVKATGRTWDSITDNQAADWHMELADGCRHTVRRPAAGRT